VIDLWYVIGSVCIPGLLLPVLGIYIRPFLLRRSYAVVALLLPTIVSLGWLIMGTLYPSDNQGYLYLGVEPFYPGLLIAVIIWLIGRERQVE
jgi:SSS family solute:Na+ symporter